MLARCVYLFVCIVLIIIVCVCFLCCCLFGFFGIAVLSPFVLCVFMSLCVGCHIMSGCFFVSLLFVGFCC